MTNERLLTILLGAGAFLLAIVLTLFWWVMTTFIVDDLSPALTIFGYALLGVAVPFLAFLYLTQIPATPSWSCSDPANRKP